ncbi:MAG: ABC transporter permease [Chloroflexota bacterium]|nr:ABC transporter permease [Chloroflexota bacterium]
MQQNPIALDIPEVLEPANKPAMVEPELTARQLTQTHLVWIRFRRHKPAMIGAAVLFLMILLAVFAPLVTPESPYNQFSYDVTNQDLSPRVSPAWYFILGTDDNGHTMLSQIVWGARISLMVGFIGAFGSSLIGTAVGAIAGYFGGGVDTVMMRVTDIFLTLPFLPTLLVTADIFGAGHVWIIIGIFIFFFWPVTARLSRASFLSLRTQEFTEAARSVGVSSRRIIVRHLLPNALRPVIVATTLAVANFIVVEAAIDFLGAGIVYPDTSWGSILANSQTGFGTGNWWWAMFPGLALVLMVLSINFLGDGLGDALDVRSKV